LISTSQVSYISNIYLSKAITNNRLQYKSSIHEKRDDKRNNNYSDQYYPEKATVHDFS